MLLNTGADALDSEDARQLTLSNPILIDLQKVRKGLGDTRALVWICQDLVASCTPERWLPYFTAQRSSASAVLVPHDDRWRSLPLTCCVLRVRRRRA